MSDDNSIKINFIDPETGEAAQAAGNAPGQAHAPKGDADGEQETALNMTNDTTADTTPDMVNDPDIELELTDDELRVLCAERVCPECPEKAETDDAKLRMLAEMENFRKRVNREKEEHCKFAAETLLADLLPVLDNLDLALAHAGGDEACKNLVMGVDMTRKVFLDVLAGHGLTPVGEAGQEFSPEIHEAVGQEERDDVEPGTVVQIMRRGYVLKGRTLRPARVVVSSKPK